MFTKSETESTPGQYETIVGAQVKVEGTFTGQGNLLIEGIVDGNIETKNDVTIATGAKIKANIIATNTYIAGHVTGNISASKHVVLKEQSQVTGDITAESIEIQAGAIFNGTSSMKGGSTNTNPKPKTNPEPSQA